MHWSSTHLYNWSKREPAAAQRSWILRGQRVKWCWGGAVCVVPESLFSVPTAPQLCYVWLIRLFWWRLPEGASIGEREHAQDHTHAFTHTLRRLRVAVQDSPWLWSDTFLLSLDLLRWVEGLIHPPSWTGFYLCSCSPAGLWSIAHQRHFFFSELAVLVLCTLFPSLSFSHQAFEAKIKTQKLSDKCYPLA